jgi:hypothetical protein
MKLIPFVLVSAICVAMSATPHAQSATIASDLLKDWRAQKETMMKIADAMPADKFGYKPTPPQRSYGEQILHVAGANVMLLKFLGAKAATPLALVETDFATFGLKMTAKPEILKALSDSFDYGEAVLKELSAASFGETMKGPPWIGEATRAKMVYYTMGHNLDIYGQMVVYLRLNGGVPPASRRGGV